MRRIDQQNCVYCAQTYNKEREYGYFSPISIWCIKWSIFFCQFHLFKLRKWYRTVSSTVSRSSPEWVDVYCPYNLVFTLNVGVPGCEKFTIKWSLHIFVSLHSIKALLLQRWTCKLFFFSKSANPKSANSPAHSATTNPQISEEGQSASRKCAIFLWFTEVKSP
jgi:hypothetical protein